MAVFGQLYRQSLKEIDLSVSVIASSESIICAVV